MLKKHFNLLIDGSIIVIFILFALMHTLGSVGDSFFRNTWLTSDAANIASFTAGLDHPELFIKDPLLGDPKNFAFYFTIQILLLQWLNPIFGNYGTAFASLLFPTVFIQLVGFYFLGRVLYHNRFWALLLAIATSIFTIINLWEYWGFYEDPLPRSMFQGLLPFLLGAAIRRGGQLKSWPWIMGFAGLLVYVHPVSAPAWGAAILLGLWFSASSIPFKQKLKFAIFSGVIFLLVISPFAINYLTTFQHSDTQNYDQVMQILSKRFNPQYLNLPYALTVYFQMVMNASWAHRILWIWAVAGFGIATYLQHKRSAQERYPQILASWWAGLLLVTVVIPLLDHGISSLLRRTPLEFDLIRGLRYTIPLLWVVSFWAMAEIYNGLQQWISKQHPWIFRISVMTVVTAGAALVIIWANQNQFFNQSYIFSTYTCWTRGTFICPKPQTNERADFLDAIRTLTPTGSSILYQDMAVRYYALRPITYINKDGGSLGYANHKALITFWEQAQEMNAIEKIADPSAYKTAFSEFAHRYGADYLVFPEEFDSQRFYPPQLKLIYSNSYASLFEVVR